MSLSDVLPGYAEALSKGYHLHSYGADKTSALYVKGPLALSVWKAEEGKEEAELKALYKMVKLSVGPISFPHPSFRTFEIQIRTCLPE